MVVFFACSLAQATCPRFPFPINPDQAWKNDQDLDDCIRNLSHLISSTTSGGGSLTPGSSNYIQNRPTLQTGSTAYPDFLNVGTNATIPTLNSTTITTANETVTLGLNSSSITASNYIFSSSGTLTNLSSTNGNITNLQVSTEQWKGFGIIPILQIQNYTTVISSSVTNATFTNTLLSGSFTPKLATSKILIWVQGDFAQQTGTSVGYATIARNGSSLAATNGGFTLTVAGNNYSSSMITYDSPATTSAITYSVQIRTNGGGTAIFPITDGGSFTSTANMIVAEIAQ